MEFAPGTSEDPVLAARKYFQENPDALASAVGAYVEAHPEEFAATDEIHNVQQVAEMLGLDLTDFSTKEN